MKKIPSIIAVLAIAGTAFAQVDPQRPMVTGKGNVDVRPANIVITNQTAEPADAEIVVLDKYEFTGSLLPKAPAPAKAPQRVRLKHR